MLAQTALFHLHQLQSTSVRVCQHIAEENHPILHVIRDGKGTWIFLCGKGHRHDHHEGIALPLKELVKQDVTLNAVSALAPHDFAERPAPDQPWTMGDQLALEIPETIEEHGWFVALVNDESNTPTTYFAYSIGIEKTQDHPELIMLGQSPDIMPQIINDVGTRIKRGELLRDGSKLPGLMPGALCECKTMHSTWYRDYLGYGLWYHGNENFEVIQVFWPDSKGLYPWDPDCDPDVIRAQPDLSMAKQ